jgi:hypothetical protein
MPSAATRTSDGAGVLCGVEALLGIELGCKASQSSVSPLRHEAIRGVRRTRRAPIAKQAAEEQQSGLL